AVGPGPPVGTPRRAPAAASVVVRPGDSLWAIAARHLPPSASVADTARAVHRLYAANADRIGPDPDLVRPGTPLVLPHLDPQRKDPS
ncbi:MAG: LysM peptidoglycan-binding domain-containing protein, partial [Nocardioidaceae bacterium]|nr:LysM peptidoglycan-binding domain-containing protein [Nocardioidaceae bacterium]